MRIGTDFHPPQRVGLVTTRLADELDAADASLVWREGLIRIRLATRSSLVLPLPTPLVIRQVWDVTDRRVRTRLPSCTTWVPVAWTRRPEILSEIWAGNLKYGLATTTRSSSRTLRLQARERVRRSLG